MEETTDRVAIEAPIQAAWDASDYALAAQHIIEIYGQELIGFLASMLSGPDEGGDAFQVFCEQMWKSLPTFRGASSFRTWCYAIARHAGSRELRSPHRRADRRVPLSSAPEIAQLAERVRTTTVQYLRTEAKERVAALREQLDEEERALFVLRLNRKMSWTDIARVIDGDEITEPEVKKRAAALRKRFQRAKDRLREAVGVDE